MQAIRERYAPALADYIRYGDEISLYRAAELGRLMNGFQPDAIAALHDETKRRLLANVDMDEEIRLFNRSFVFLTELMAAWRLDGKSGGRPVHRLPEMKEQRTRSAESFENVKNKYESILQHMDSGIGLFNREGILTFVNVRMASLLGTPRHELVGRSLTEIVRHRKLAPAARRHLIKLAKDTTRQRIKLHELVDPNGRHLLITITSADELDDDYLVSVKDVTEFKQIEQSAYQNDKLAMLGKISAAIAHEIRNPLTAIRGFIQLLRPHLEQLGKEEYARIILMEIDRANDIIYEFLNSSKPSAPQRQDVSIGTLMKEVVLLSESEALMKGCQISLAGGREELTISIDAKQIKQVILNIVRNAIDAISDLQGVRNGRIELSARREGDYASIEIRDNGKGMDRSVMNRLFDPFFTTKEAGTGLGLSVSYRIIRNHGGAILVNSEEGEGTSFRIRLPLAR